jgi:hypothetical protein
MSITLNIPEALASELTLEAQKAGLALSDYVLSLLAAGRSAEPLPTAGAALAAYWQEQGLVGFRPDIADREFARPRPTLR